MGPVVQGACIRKGIDLEHDIAVKIRLAIVLVSRDRQVLVQGAQGVEGSVDGRRGVEVALLVLAVLQFVQVKHDIAPAQFFQVAWQHLAGTFRLGKIFRNQPGEKAADFCQVLVAGGQRVAGFQLVFLDEVRHLGHFPVDEGEVFLSFHMTPYSFSKKWFLYSSSMMVSISSKMP